VRDVSGHAGENLLSRSEGFFKLDAEAGFDLENCHFQYHLEFSQKNLP
jgi:hypothetical protein